MKKIVSTIFGLTLLALSGNALASTPSVSRMECTPYYYGFIEFDNIPNGGTRLFYGVFYNGRYLEHHNDWIYPWNDYRHSFNGDFIPSNLRDGSYLVAKIGGKWKVKRCRS